MSFTVGHQPLSEVSTDATDDAQSDPDLRSGVGQCGVRQAGVDVRAVYDDSVPAGIGSWQGGGPPVPPGSLVVVPQDPSPYETWGFIRDITQVLGQVSVSAAALAVISRQAR